ncbi:Cid1_family poly A polymerase-containing protein [Hexamita inflata]|uniref:Cid1 family poly A polymerase-containing protein n=1 Tax=Hexamita inflata TaxID=28002 RepID=A0AA86RF20_9EUKA|nr:Cid1 family poly A polymerase-containing protein [Hexamita inflata]
MQTKANIENQLQAKLNQLKRNTIPQECLNFCLDFVHTRVGKVIKNFEVKPYGGAANQLSSMKNGDIDCTIICDLYNIQIVQKDKIDQLDHAIRKLDRYRPGDNLLKAFKPHINSDKANEIIVNAENIVKQHILELLGLGNIMDDNPYDNNPTIRFSVQYQDLTVFVDLTINSDYPLKNTRYIRQCIEKYQYTRDLILCIKHIIQVNELTRTDSHRNIKSYSIYMMVIHYLRNNNQTFNYFNEYLIGFLNYYDKFNWQYNKIIQCDDFKQIDNSPKTLQQLAQYGRLQILDPFELNRNVADNMTDKSTQQLFLLFKNEYKKFQKLLQLQENKSTQQKVE